MSTMQFPSISIHLLFEFKAQSENGIQGDILLKIAV